LAEKNDGTVTVEVEKRLEDLFREDGESFDFLEEKYLLISWKIMAISSTLLPGS
jgi:hypothetical protein